MQTARTLLLFCIWTSLNALPSFGDDELFTYGALACVAQLQRDNPSQPKDLKDDDLSVISRSSGFFVGDSANRVYLITAAHNLVDCTDLRITHAQIGTQAVPASIINKESKRRFRKYVYIDQAEDVAVFQLADDVAQNLRKSATDKQNIRTPGKVVGTFWKPGVVEQADKKTPLQQRVRPQALMPRGGVASSAGTISESIVANQPAYSCTVSRYLKGKDLNVPLRTVYTTKTPKLELQAFRDGVVTRVRNQRFLIVESMSITAGFSGSPIMISKDYFYDDGDIIGVVLGGTDSYQVGRHVWAAPSDVIEKAIERTAMANDNVSELKWSQFGPTQVEVLQDPTAIGRWITSSDISTLKFFLDEEFQSPFAGRYSIESRVEFTGIGPNARLCEHKLLARIQDLPGRAFRFQNITFSVTCLDNVNLLSPYFKACTFDSTRFYASVITGAVFDGCRYRNGGKVTDIKDILERPCANCSPAAIIAPRFVGTYIEPNNEKDDGLTRTKK